LAYRQPHPDRACIEPGFVFGPPSRRIGNGSCLRARLIPMRHRSELWKALTGASRSPPHSAGMSAVSRWRTAPLAAPAVRRQAHVRPSIPHR